MSQTNYETQADVAIVSMNNPPVNGLGFDLRMGIVEGIRKALADPALQARSKKMNKPFCKKKIFQKELFKKI